MSEFDTLFERALGRFESGGYLVGDRVRFRKDALKLDYIAKRAQSFRDIITACMDPAFDLNLRIGAIKSIYPSSSTNFQAGPVAPDGVFVDVYIEYAPGLFKSPMTVPIEAIESMDDGTGRGPIPDSLRRKNNVHGPKEVTTSQTDSQVNLATSNTKLPGANSWDDYSPGGGNFQL